MYTIGYKNNLLFKGGGIPVVKDIWKIWNKNNQLALLNIRFLENSFIEIKRP